MTAAYFDQDRSFMLIEISGVGAPFSIRVASPAASLDSGVITRQASPAAAARRLQGPSEGVR